MPEIERGFIASFDDIGSRRIGGVITTVRGDTVSFALTTQHEASDRDGVVVFHKQPRRKFDFLRSGDPVALERTLDGKQVAKWGVLQANGHNHRANGHHNGNGTQHRDGVE